MMDDLLIDGASGFEDAQRVERNRAVEPQRQVRRAISVTEIAGSLYRSSPNAAPQALLYSKLDMLVQMWFLGFQRYCHREVLTSDF